MGHPQNRKQRYQRRTEPRPQKFTKMGKFVRVVFKLGEETDRQTDRQKCAICRCCGEQCPIEHRVAYSIDRLRRDVGLLVKRATDNPSAFG